MIEIYDKDKAIWTQFYLIDVNTDEVYEKKLEELPKEVVGKYVSGVVGYSPVWNYAVVEKDKLREIEK